MRKIFMIYDTIIIGAGIAGITAGIYASRQNMNFKLISENVGGQFLGSGDILNYPGFNSIQGLEFENKLNDQIKFNNFDVDIDSVNKINEIKKFKKNVYEIVCNKNKYLSKTIIIATGAKPKTLNVKGEDVFFKKGLTYCSICDGPLFNGKKVAVVGGGNSALEAADYMSKIAKKVNLIVNGSSLTGFEYLKQRVVKNKKIKIFYNSKVKEICGDKFVNSISIISNKNEKISNLKLEGIIVEIGRVPNTDFFRGLVELDEHNHILINCKTETSKQGIFAAGDCSSSHEYQYVIAAGQGCMALLKASKYIIDNNL
jgi:thioredoxin-disulfide reductase